MIAAPIVGQIIEDIAPIIGIEKQTEQLERKYVWGDELTARVENFVGQTAEKIVEQLYPYRIQWHGTGNKVVQQLPEADSIIHQDEILNLYLGN